VAAADSSGGSGGVGFGKYRIQRKLGHGAFGAVYEAHLPGPMGFTKKVAVKLLRPQLIESDEQFVQAMVNEARIGGLLHHANIVDILEFGEVEGRYYLAMEFVDGLTLSQIIQICRVRRVLLPRFAILDLALQICRGLHFAHTFVDEHGARLDLVHRDLKPSNIIVDRSGTAKILDFGIAKAASNLFETTASGVIKGTPRYMSPEQITGEAEMTPRSDIFSLGVVLFELTTGNYLFHAESMAQLMHAILMDSFEDRLQQVETAFPGMGPILERALHRETTDRYPDVQALAQDLRRLERIYLPAADLGDVIQRLTDDPALSRTQEVVESDDLLDDFDSMSDEFETATASSEEIPRATPGPDADEWADFSQAIGQPTAGDPGSTPSDDRETRVWEATSTEDTAPRDDDLAAASQPRSPRTGRLALAGTVLLATVCAVVFLQVRGPSEPPPDPPAQQPLPDSPQLDPTASWHWRPVASLPGPRSGAVAFPLDGQGYLCAGNSGADAVPDRDGVEETLLSQYHDDCFRYDPRDDRWTEVASFPRRVTSAIAFEIDGELFAGTGYNDPYARESAFMARYDIDTDAWLEVATLLTTADSTVAFSVGGHGYVCGGDQDDETELWSSACYRYQIDDDTWTLSQSLPGPARSNAVAFVDRGIAHVCGGSAEGIPYLGCHRFDPDHARWAESPSPGGLEGILAAFTVDDVPVVCGHAPDGESYACRAWDGAREIWIDAPTFPGGLAGDPGVFSLGHCAYVCGGNDGGFHSDCHALCPDSWPATPVRTSVLARHFVQRSRGSLVAWGQDVHVLWAAQPAGDECACQAISLYHAVSGDGGATFTLPDVLASGAFGVEFASMAATDAGMVAVYGEGANAHCTSVTPVVLRLPTCLAEWTEVQRFSPVLGDGRGEYDAGHTMDCSLASSGNRVVMACAVNTGETGPTTQRAEVFTATSDDGGATWSKMIALPGAIFQPHCAHDLVATAATLDTLYVAWFANVDGNDEVLLARSKDNGATWEVDAIWPDEGTDRHPAIDAYGDTVAVTWRKGKGSTVQARVAISEDRGETWAVSTEIGPRSTLSLGIEVANERTVYLTRVQQRDGRTEMALTRSTDAGGTWEPETAVVTPGAGRFAPGGEEGWLRVDGTGTAHVLWRDREQECTRGSWVYTRLE
jgi:serine/threonine protein kinase